MAMVAEFEGDLIRMRTREGMKVAKAKGRLRGKQPKLNVRQEAHLVALHRSGDHTVSELGDLFGVALPLCTVRSSGMRSVSAPSSPLDRRWAARSPEESQKGSPTGTHFRTAQVRCAAEHTASALADRHRWTGDGGNRPLPAIRCGWHWR